VKKEFSKKHRELLDSSTGSLRKKCGSMVARDYAEALKWENYEEREKNTKDPMGGHL